MLRGGSHAAFVLLIEEGLRGYAGKKGEMSFEEAGQGAGIGGVSGTLTVVCVEDLPLLVHHKAGGQLQLVALIGTVLVA